MLPSRTTFSPLASGFWLLDLDSGLSPVSLPTSHTLSLPLIPPAEPPSPRPFHYTVQELGPHPCPSSLLELRLLLLLLLRLTAIVGRALNPVTLSPSRIEDGLGAYTCSLPHRTLALGPRKDQHWSRSRSRSFSALSSPSPSPSAYAPLPPRYKPPESTMSSSQSIADNPRSTTNGPRPTANASAPLPPSAPLAPPWGLPLPTHINKHMQHAPFANASLPIRPPCQHAPQTSSKAASLA